VPGDAQDNHGDRETDQGVSDLEAGGDSRGTGDDGKADVSVGARMCAVRLECRAVEPAPGAAADDGGQPVADESERSRDRECGEVLDVARMDQPGDGLVTGDARADEDRQTTANPARRSARALRIANAMASGMAVAASPKLWIRSASSATDPDATNTSVCAVAVAARMSKASPTARRPARERLMDASTRPWLWP
jgi:hypothetical protein